MDVLKSRVLRHIRVRVPQTVGDLPACLQGDKVQRQPGFLQARTLTRQTFSDHPSLIIDNRTQAVVWMSPVPSKSCHVTCHLSRVSGCKLC